MNARTKYNLPDFKCLKCGEVDKATKTGNQSWCNKCHNKHAQTKNNMTPLKKREKNIKKLAKHIIYLLPDHTKSLQCYSKNSKKIEDIENVIYWTVQCIHEEDPTMGDALTDDLRKFLHTCE